MTSPRPDELADDREFLRHQQYRDAHNLAARIALHARFSTNPTPFVRWLFDQLDIAPDARILDVGAGTGLFWRDNAERLPAGWQPTLSDLSTGMIAAARAGWSGSLPARFAAADAAALPFADGAFDVVFAHHMLYHVPDRAAALNEFHRVLRPGGRLYAATNGSAHLREIRQWTSSFRLETLFGHERSPRNFGLTNGESQLQPWFEQIQLERYADSLRVTELEPLLAHIESTLDDPARWTRQMTSLRNYLEHKLQTSGALQISKSTGLFIAVRRDVPLPAR